ncbi:M1 family metallopeptidase [Azohydromonas australica]|uniref:M1 family metallopeptidase n=1 Tax=Azohydromonas australica TaxID=364039 RepID=UPI0007E8C37C|nr:M1 family aminopeptidase [Azohydromonas australica]
MPAQPMAAACLAALLAALPLAAAAAPAPPPTAAHHLTLHLDPAAGRLQGHDRLTLPAGYRGALLLELGEALELQSATAQGRALPFTREGERVRIALPPGTASLELRYTGRLAGAEAPRIAAEGSWLPGDFAWYPRLDWSDALQVEVHTPAGQQAALTGALRREDHTGEGTRAVYAAYPGEPPTLFAGPWQCQARQHRGLRLRACFHAEVASLAGAYLDDAARHIDRYAAQLGPYAYAGFDMLSGPDPVGLGYPGLTYVSRAILPLPFMRARSLPHEVLHTWWGNGVRVRTGGGNWAEGLTTYQSDYGLADAAARERMRREWLRDHAALPSDADQPLTAFVTKAHARDQVVGYGKGAFVFHMLEQQLGTPAFDAGLRRFYAAQRGREAGWAELQSAFEAASGQRLDAFFRQWLTRAGAPALALRDVAWRDDGLSLSLAQTQAGAPYALRVPVAVDTELGRETHWVTLEGAAARVELATRARPVGLQVDAQADLFRRLVPGERAPILRDLLLQPSAQAVLAGVPADAIPTAQALAAQLLPDAAAPVEPGAWDRARPALLLGVGRPEAVAAALGLPPPALPAESAGAGASALAWAVPGAAAPTVAVAAADRAALEALLRPLRHYGAQSWVRFDGARLLDQGLWPVAADNALSARR